jgi:hypothetical protein
MMIGHQNNAGLPHVLQQSATLVTIRSASEVWIGGVVIRHTLR